MYPLPSHGHQCQWGTRRCRSFNTHTPLYRRRAQWLHHNISYLIPSYMCRHSMGKNMFDRQTILHHRPLLTRCQRYVLCSPLCPGLICSFSNGRPSRPHSMVMRSMGRRMLSRWSLESGMCIVCLLFVLVSLIFQAGHGYTPHVFNGEAFLTNCNPSLVCVLSSREAWSLANKFTRQVTTPRRIKPPACSSRKSHRTST